MEGLDGGQREDGGVGSCWFEGSVVKDREFMVTCLQIFCHAVSLPFLSVVHK